MTFALETHSQAIKLNRLRHIFTISSAVYLDPHSPSSQSRSGESARTIHGRIDRPV